MRKRGYSKNPAAVSKRHSEDEAEGEGTTGGVDYGQLGYQNTRELSAQRVMREMNAERPVREMEGERPEMG